MHALLIQFFFSISLMLMHPVHVSVSTIDIAKAEDSFELTIKLFSDDFESIVNQTYQSSLQLSRQVDPGEEISFVNQYVNSTFEVKINGKNIAELNYLRYQMNEESIWLYYHCISETKIKSVNGGYFSMNDCKVFRAQVFCIK